MCSQPDVDEALRLMRMSKVSLFDDEACGAAVDPVSAVYARLRDDAQRTRRGSYAWPDLLQLLGQSFSVRWGNSQQLQPKPVCSCVTHCSGATPICHPSFQPTMLLGG